MMCRPFEQHSEQRLRQRQGLWSARKWPIPPGDEGR